MAGIGTYAWFNSQVTSTSNTIQTGKLEIRTLCDGNPDPLFYVKEEYGIDGIYNNDKWYPCAQISNRMWTIKNSGDFNALVYGVSADIEDFVIPEKSTYSKEQALKDFQDNFIITIKKLQFAKVEEVFTSSLAKLQSIQKFSGTPTVLGLQKTEIWLPLILQKG